MEIRQRDGFSGERSIVLPKMILDKIKSDPLLSALYITDIGFYPDAKYHFRERSEPIDQYVFIYCTAGAGWFAVNGVRQEVNKNSYFILPPGLPHSYGSEEDNPWTIYWIHFGGTLAEYYADNCLMPHYITPNKDSRIMTRINLFEELFNALDAGFNLESIRYAMSSFHHYLGSLRYLKGYKGSETGHIDENVVDETIHFMTENLERNLTLTEISNYSGFSKSYLSAMFKERTGNSLLSNFNLLKVKYACHLLDTTTMKLNRICFKIGIFDPYYFSRMFSKIMGMSPIAYRHRAKA